MCLVVRAFQSAGAGPGIIEYDSGDHVWNEWMRKNSQLSRTLHVLLHMARHDGAFTSAQIGKMLGTNAVVVRRTLSGLRDAGFVQSEKGHRGGWKIARNLGKVTLFDIYQSLGSPRLFAIGSDSESPSCAVEAVVNDALANALDEAEARLLKRLGQIALSDLSREFDRRCVAGGWDKAHKY
jgi:DNA-binding IscR family transcriptional regulator